MEHDILIKIAELENISPEWLLFGLGDMRRSAENPKDTSRPAAIYDRDELIIALRENAALHKENGELKLELERMKAQVAEWRRQVSKEEI